MGEYYPLNIICLDARLIDIGRYDNGVYLNLL